MAFLRWDCLVILKLPHNHPTKTSLFIKLTTGIHISDDKLSCSLFFLKVAYSPQTCIFCTVSTLSAHNILPLHAHGIVTENGYSRPLKHTSLFQGLLLSHVYAVFREIGPTYSIMGYVQFALQISIALSIPQSFFPGVETLCIAWIIFKPPVQLPTSMCAVFAQGKLSMHKQGSAEGTILASTNSSRSNLC